MKEKIEQQKAVLKLPVHEREQFLNIHADDIKEGQYFRRFDDDDVKTIHDEFMMKSIEIKRKKDEFDAIKAKFKIELKKLEDQNKLMMSQIMQNGEWLNGKTYGFADQVSRTMTYLNKQGDYVDSRRLSPNETQLTIMSKTN